MPHLFALRSLKPLLACAGALLLLFTAPRLEAAPARFHPDLLRAQEQFRAAEGPRAYAALRRIWATWDRADPIQVEEALLEAERSARTPAIRAYAGLLAAYGRNRRGDFKSARDKIKQLGFVDRWLIVGPFDNEGKTGFDVEIGPEQDFAQPIAPGRAYSGKERPVRWRNVPLAFPFGWLDSGALLRPERRVCLFATTFVSAAKDSPAPRPFTAWVGVSGAFKLFFNGEPVLADAAYRGHDADRRAALLELQPGQNNLTIKACGEDAAPVISLRLADARGAPDPKLSIDSDISASVEAANLVKRQKAKAPKARPRTAPAALEGPLQSFERITAAKTARPADLQAHAEYLVLSGGDDPKEHAARNLAQRAAAAEPSVERLLLVAALAEDRNKQAEWLLQAERLAQQSGKRSVELLLARAAHARGGPSWRDAFPFYDRVLDLDPERIPAIRGRVELYNEAGMQRTALATLERAVDRAPYAVNLLNMYASQLRALGRASEAAVVEDRYAALRFDDRSYLNSMIELAVARRDQPAAERWTQRLLEADPDSQWALGVAARTQRALGQPERAIATYRRALELAPEDVGTLRALSDLLGELGRRDEQLGTLREILRIRPQERDVREYVEHIGPGKPRPDEAYAWDSKQFLKLRHAPAMGHNRRTLRDLTVTTVYENGLSSKFRQTVFQPLTDAAAAISRQYAFQYQADSEVVQLRGARVFRGDGRVDEAIEYGEAAANDPSIAMYTSARNFYVQLPRLEPGDVVELRYRIDDITPRNEFADYFGDVVYLQSNEPVSNAAYVLIAPKSRTLHVDQRVPGLKQSVKELKDQRVMSFFAEQIAPLPPEPEMPAWPEVLGFVHVSTYKSWQDLGRWYWGFVKDQFDLDDETRRLAREITKGKKTDLEKVRAVYGWVIKNTRYVALEFGIYGYKPRRCVQTVSRGWGDCKDKATVIATLLEELKIPSTIVILRTQMRGGFPSTLPSLAPFDHAIVYVPSLDLYLDGTAEFHGSGELPVMDQGALALHVNRGNAKLLTVPEPPPEKNAIERRVVAHLGRDGAAKLELDYATRGASAAEWRERYGGEGTRRERVLADLGREFPGFSLAEGAAGVTTSELVDIEQPAALHARGTAPSFARREGTQLSMSVTTGARLTPKYASLSQRTQDVRTLGFSTIDDTFTVKLPGGMKVVSAPPNTSADTPFGSYSVQVETQPGQVVIKSRVLLRTTRIRPKDYPAWKKFCAAADEALSRRLILGS
jgi:cellulose synthase operon protein C